MPFDYTNPFNIEVDCASSGNNTLYAVPAGKKLVVTYAFLQAEADVTAQLRSAAVDLTGPMEFTTATALERTFYNSGAPIFKTITAGDDLILNLGGAVQVNGFLVAMEVHQ